MALALRLCPFVRERDFDPNWCPSTAPFLSGWTHAGVSNPEMRIFRQGQGLFRRIAELDSIHAAHQGWGPWMIHSQIKGLRGDVAGHVAQAISKIDAEIGKIDHLWMETNWLSSSSNLLSSPLLVLTWMPRLFMIDLRFAYCSRTYLRS